MRQWQLAVARAGDALVAAHACEQAGIDLDVAITARAALLEHVATVLDDVVERPRMRGTGALGPQVPVGLLETDPIDALARVLRGRSRLILDRAPSELLDVGRAANAATAVWVEVGKQALIAARAWDHRGPAVLSGEQAWHTVGEVAALASAISVLDRDLSHLAADRADVATVLKSTAGLSIAAREVCAIAAPTTVAGGSTVTPPVTRSPADVGDALAARACRASTIERELRRLTSLLDRAAELTPHHVRAGVEIARDLSVFAAGGATGPSGDPVRAELADLARALHATCRSKLSEFAINPVRPRVLELQFRDLRSKVKLALASGHGLDADGATTLARRLPALVETLARQAEIQVSNGRWAIPNCREGDTLPYALASINNPAHIPAMLGPLTEARTTAETLRVSLNSHPPSSSLVAILTRLPERRGPQRSAHPAAAAVAHVPPPTSPGL